MPSRHDHHLLAENLDSDEGLSRDAGDPRTFTEQDLTGRVLLDGGTFERCRFRNASLVYFGGAAPSMVGCSFDGVSFEFNGAAARTVAFLQGMSAPRSGLSSVFKATFPKLFGH